MSKPHVPTRIKIRDALLGGAELTIMGMVEKFETPHGAEYINQLRKQGIPITSIPIPGSTRVRYRIPPAKLSELRKKFELK